MQPNPNSPYLIDSLGFRRTPFNFNNRLPEELYRIVTLGDSITFGSTNDEYFNYPSYLEFILNSVEFEIKLPGNKKYVDIMNAGVMGYNSGNAKNYLFDTILDLNPDAVVVTIGANDLRRSFSPKVFTYLEDYFPGFFWFYHSSALISNLRKWILPFINVNRKQNKNQGKKVISVGENEYALLSYKKNLIQIVEGLKARGIGMIFVPWPLTPGVTVGNVGHFSFKDMTINNQQTLSLYKKFTSVMREVAMKYKVPLIQTPFQIPLNPANHNVQFFMASSIHLNNAGSRIFAFVIADAIKGLMRGEDSQSINSKSWGNVKDSDVLDFYIWIKHNFEIKNKDKVRKIIKVREMHIANHCMSKTRKDLTVVNLHFSECFFSIPDTALNLIYEEQLERATAYLDYATQTYPEWAYPFYVYGIHQLRVRKKEQARKNFEKAIRLAPYFNAPKVMLGKKTLNRFPFY